MLVRYTLAVVVALSPVAAADQRAHAPAAGSAERKSVLDALRPSVEARFRAPVEFLQPNICIWNGWATVVADPRRKGGGAVPWRNYLSKDEYELGGDQVSAVLRVKQGRWNLVDSAVGATDVWCLNLVPAPLRSGC